MGYEELTDSELMARFYDCQEPAFDCLAQRWWPRLFGFFIRLGFSTEAAEDLSQEAIIRLYGTKEQRSFDVGHPLDPFLLRIAHNLAVGEWRSEQVRRITPEDAGALCPADDAALPPELLLDLLGCVSQLPEMERTYIALCGKHGLGDSSHIEISELWDKWPAQVTQISQKARAHLRTCLGAKGYS